MAQGMSALGHSEPPQVKHGLPSDFCLADCCIGFFWASPHGYINGHDAAEMHDAACRLVAAEVLTAQQGMVLKAS